MGSGVVRLCLSPARTEWLPYPARRVFSCGSTGFHNMTLTRFVSKNAFRNKRRSILTVLSIGFLAAVADPDDDHLARLLYRPGQRRISAPADDPPQSFADFRACRVSIARKFVRCPEWWPSCQLRGLAAYIRTTSRRTSSRSSAPIPTSSSRFTARFKFPPEQRGGLATRSPGVIVDDTLAKKYGWKLGDRIV